MTVDENSLHDTDALLVARSFQAAERRLMSYKLPKDGCEFERLTAQQFQEALGKAFSDSLPKPLIRQFYPGTDLSNRIVSKVGQTLLEASKTTSYGDAIGAALGLAFRAGWEAREALVEVDDLEKSVK